MNNSEALAFTIPEWCARHRISRGMFYRFLDRRGEAPDTLWFGRRRVIPVRADQRWEEEQLASTRKSPKATPTTEPARRRQPRAPKRSTKRTPRK